MGVAKLHSACHEVLFQRVRVQRPTGPGEDPKSPETLSLTWSNEIHTSPLQ